MISLVNFRNVTVSDGAVIHVAAGGTDKRPPVVLLHSLLGSHAAWLPVMAALSLERTAIVPDLRGHGASSPTSGPYSIARLAADVVDVLDAFNVSRAHIVGVSIGSMIAQQLACDYADRCCTVTAAAAGPTVPEAMWPQWDQRCAVVRAQGVESQVEISLARWFTGSVSMRARDLAREMIVATSVAGFVGCVGAVKRHNLVEKLSNISLPTLVIAGEEDESVPLQAVKALAALIPGADFLVVPGVRHQLALQEPQVFVRALQNQITKH